ncbi:MAG: nitronate monooxygenase [Holosporales bacterium]|jgi:NAD(P)H-dependent flavin oxidoreductase YrpB (nitropropane dioxygenase family)|nr:nitronate monooxygenase [Holosporales bacterium]
MDESKVKPIIISGTEVLPLVEGGKGIAISDGLSSGSWAAEGGVGTFSAVNAHIPGHEELSFLDSYSSKIRIKRHAEMVERAIIGGISQAKIAYETACGRGRIHMNVMWEMGGVEDVLHGILSKVKDLIHGVTCGAGMPFRLAEICAKYNLKYYPIVSSARAFNILWKRAYCRLSEWLGGVVYEDPWLAGGHNGLSNNEDENIPEPPEPRVRSLRSLMRSVGISDLVPIFMAGGIWRLSEWADWIDNPELGAIAFQFGTRPLLTAESPIPLAWKKALLTLKPGDISLNRFSPTGFPSSANRNAFLRYLQARSERQVLYVTSPDERCTEPFKAFSQNTRVQEVFISAADRNDINAWVASGYSVALITPSHTLVFVTPEEHEEIEHDRRQCIGCLSACNFSGWSQNPSHQPYPDPRLFCIQRSLQKISITGDVENALMFCGHQGYRFGTDPFYANGRIPSVKELVTEIRKGG